MINMNDRADDVVPASGGGQQEAVHPAPSAPRRRITEDELPLRRILIRVLLGWNRAFIRRFDARICRVGGDAERRSAVRSGRPARMIPTTFAAVAGYAGAHQATTNGCLPLVVAASTVVLGAIWAAIGARDGRK